jgi:ribonuclease P protein component
MSPSPLPGARVGLIVPRLGHTAVERNRLKRRLRELIAMENFPPGLDVVLVAGHTAYDLPFSDLRSKVNWIVNRLTPGVHP